MTKTTHLLAALKQPLISLAVLALPMAATAQPAWQVVDTFDNASAQANWTISNSMAVDFTDNQLKFTNTSPITTQSMYAPLPFQTSNGKVTVYLDLYLPAGQVQHQAGFGVGSAEQMALGSWNTVGNRNRFQTANAAPQTLVKAGDWSYDVLDPTLQAAWYNIWIVYDLEAQKFSLYHRRADAESLDAVFSKEWDFATGTVDDLSTISHFALGAGALEQAVEGFSAIGAIVDNIHAAPGENLTVAGRIDEPPSWVAVDTFSNGSADATWAGDTGSFNFDFSEGYLDLTPTSTTNRSNIYVELPETMIGGRFTVTFDLYVPDSAARKDIGFGVVGETQLALSGWDQRGGNDRMGVFGTNGNLSKAADFANVIIPGTSLQGQWYHIWMSYDITLKTMSFYYSSDKQAPDAANPAATYVLVNDYTNFSHFIIGLDRTDNPGVGIDNLYFVADESITLSPTAGDLNPPSGIQPPALGWVNDSVLSNFWHYGNFYGYWRGTKATNLLGYIYLANRAQDGSGWMYHFNQGEWFYIFPGGSLVNNDLMMYSFKWGFVTASSAYDDYFYVLAPAEGVSNWQLWSPAP